MKKKLNEDIFSTWIGKSWRNWNESDIDVFPMMQELDASYHQYVLVSGESFLNTGKEIVDVFVTEDLLLKPEEFTGLNKSEDEIVVIALNDGKDLLMLTEKVVEVDEWLTAISRAPSIETYYGHHKVTADH